MLLDLAASFYADVQAAYVLHNRLIMLTHRKEQKRECVCITHYLSFAMHFPCLYTLNALLTVVSKCACVREPQASLPDGSLCNCTSKEGVEVEGEGGNFGRMELVVESAPLP